LSSSARRKFISRLQHIHIA